MCTPPLTQVSIVNKNVNYASYPSLFLCQLAYVYFTAFIEDPLFGDLKVDMMPQTTEVRIEIQPVLEFFISLMPQTFHEEIEIMEF